MIPPASSAQIFISSSRIYYHLKDEAFSPYPKVSSFFFITNCGCSVLFHKFSVTQVVRFMLALLNFDFLALPFLNTNHCNYVIRLLCRLSLNWQNLGELSWCSVAWSVSNMVSFSACIWWVYLMSCLWILHHMDASANVLYLCKIGAAFDQKICRISMRWTSVWNNWSKFSNSLQLADFWSHVIH